VAALAVPPVAALARMPGVPLRTARVVNREAAVWVIAALVLTVDLVAVTVVGWGMERARRRRGRPR
jgi:hypothetical protein